MIWSDLIWFDLFQYLHTHQKKLTEHKYQFIAFI